MSTWASSLMRDVAVQLLIFEPIADGAALEQFNPLLQPLCSLRIIPRGRDSGSPTESKAPISSLGLRPISNSPYISSMVLDLRYFCLTAAYMVCLLKKLTLWAMVILGVSTLRATSHTSPIRLNLW